MVTAIETTFATTGDATLCVKLADDDDLRRVYRARHDVYALELAQHQPNSRRELTDALDGRNVYVCVNRGNELAGFVSITAPGGRYSIDKYLPRDQVPLAFDDQLYEVRLLTVLPERRGRIVALLLMFAALQWIESRGGRRVIAIGRVEVLNLYRKLGLQPLGRRVTCGAVSFELMSATTAQLRRANADAAHVFRRAIKQVDWQLDTPPDMTAPDMTAPDMTAPDMTALDMTAPDDATAPDDTAAHEVTIAAGSVHSSVECFHGGAFFDAIGADFTDLSRRQRIINADVLDAWFPPAPGVLRALRRHLPWLARTSPPTDCGGLIDTIATARGVDRDCILPGAGSSDLIFRALRTWLSPESRVLILDPMYGEYSHVLEKVICCRVDRFALGRERRYDVDLDELQSRVQGSRYDLIVLVNPNSPTGRHVCRDALAEMLRRVSGSVGRVWIDETYIDYVGAAEHSLEGFAAASGNVFICKSMSKVYALSGMRAAYLCGPAREIASLRTITPPWVIGLPAQVAAVEALRDPQYYADRYRQTHALREALQRSLQTLGLDVIEGCANFLLTHVPPDLPRAAKIVEHCREQGVFIRDASCMGRSLGDRAIRFAVKSDPEQRAMLEFFAQAMRRSAR